MRVVGHIFAAIGLCITTAAQSAQPVDVFDQHIEVCGPAMADPEAFVSGLGNVAPGTHEVSVTEDGRIFRAIIATGNGHYTTHFSRYLLTDRGHENCATYYNDGLFNNESTAAQAQEFRSQAAELFGADNVVGGLMPQFYAEPGSGNDVLPSDYESYEFLIGGLLGLPDVISVSSVAAGQMSIVSQRELVRE